MHARVVLINDFDRIPNIRCTIKSNTEYLASKIVTIWPDAPTFEGYKFEN